jgi:hypothetical protein
MSVIDDIMERDMPTQYSVGIMIQCRQQSTVGYNYLGIHHVSFSLYLTVLPEHVTPVDPVSPARVGIPKLIDATVLP